MPNLAETLSTEQRAGAIVKVNDAKVWVVWPFTKKLRSMVGIQEFRILGDDWHSYNGMHWGTDTVHAAASIIADIAEDKAAPSIEDPTLASLVIDQWSTHTGKWIVPIDKKRVLAVYDHIYDGKPSIMLREYKKQKGWQVVGYLTIEKPAAIELGKHITALRA